MTDKIKVSKIEITTSSGVVVPLTLDEARDLFGHLEKLFGKKTAYVPAAPIYIDRWLYQSPSVPPYQYWRTWCSADNNAVKGVQTTGYCAEVKTDSGLNIRYSGDSA